MAVCWCKDVQHNVALTAWRGPDSVCLSSNRILQPTSPLHVAWWEYVFMHWQTASYQLVRHEQTCMAFDALQVSFSIDVAANTKQSEDLHGALDAVLLH